MNGRCEDIADIRLEDKMHPNVKKAFDEIDAAVFSGDTFFDAENLAELKRMLARWRAQVPWLETMAAASDEDDD